MFKMLSAAVLVMVASFGLVSVAAGAPSSDKGEAVAHYRTRGHDVSVYQIDVIEAPNTPKGMDGFANQIADVLYTWTHDHYGLEAGGNLCQTEDGSRWGIRILTFYAHTSSPQTNACPEGMHLSGVDIHSHPQKRSYMVNGVDRSFLHYGLTEESHISTEPDVYSPDDLDHPGYLVGGQFLHFRDKEGQERILRPM